MQVQKVGELDFDRDSKIDKDIINLLEGKGFILEKVSPLSAKFNIYKKTKE